MNAATPPRLRARPGRRSPGLYIVAILALAFVLRVGLAMGLSGNDDLALADNAIRITTDGLHVPQEHYAARLGLTVPLAGVFAVFGVGVWQLVVIPMAASLIGIALAFGLGTLLFEPAVGLCAAAVLALYPLDIEYAGVFFPDNVQGAALGGSVLLFLAAGRDRRSLLGPVLAGVCWAYGYYVKIDAFFLGFVLLLATALRYAGLRQLIVTGLTALVLVGAELVMYKIANGNPFYHAELEHLAANEVLAPGMDYRSALIYPKAMFLTVYETGIAFYLLLAAMLVAALRRSRPALLLTGWVLVFFVWLSCGMDPFGGAWRLKPQLVRYLLSFAIPMSVLIGWLLVLTYRHMSRWLAAAIGGVGAALALALALFNLLNYEAARATVTAADEALRRGWFPLYADSQSFGVIEFMLHDKSQAGTIRAAQRHDFLTGETSFEIIAGPTAYLLVNEDFARRLAARSLVKPIDPSQFGLRPTEVLSVDNPLPAVSYALMRGLAELSRLIPMAGLREHIENTADDVLRPGDAKIYRLDAAP